VRILAFEDAAPNWIYVGVILFWFVSTQGILQRTALWIACSASLSRLKRVEEGSMLQLLLLHTEQISLRISSFIWIVLTWSIWLTRLWLASK
jgi:hypothetical protein